EVRCPFDSSAPRGASVDSPSARDDERLSLRECGLVGRNTRGFGHREVDLALARDLEARRVAEDLYVAVAEDEAAAGPVSPVVHVRVSHVAESRDFSLCGTRVAGRGGGGDPRRAGCI